MFRWLTLAISIFLTDQIIKWLVLLYLEIDQVIPIIPGLNLQLVFNQGAAFGFLAQYSGWQTLFFIGLAILVSISIIFLLYKLDQNKLLDGVALAAILGGAVGNLADRIRFGSVIDFIDIYYRDWHWYTFNIADIAICIGAGILVITLFKNTV